MKKVGFYSPSLSGDISEDMAYYVDHDILIIEVNLSGGVEIFEREKLERGYKFQIVPFRMTKDIMDKINFELGERRKNDNIEIAEYIENHYEEFITF